MANRLYTILDKITSKVKDLDSKIYSGTVTKGSSSLSKRSTNNMVALQVISNVERSTASTTSYKSFQVSHAITPNSSALTTDTVCVDTTRASIGRTVTIFSFGGIFRFPYATNSGTYNIIFSDNVVKDTTNTSDLSVKVENGNVAYIAADYNMLCLTDGTLITMDDWSEKKISDLKIGDVILSVDGSGRYRSNKIERIDEGTDKQYDRWTFSDGSVIETCHDHVLYNVDDKKLKYVSMWKSGDRAYRIDNCNVALISHEVINKEVKHYNIICEGPTNYFANGLLAGDTRGSTIRYNIEGGFSE